MFYQPSLYQGEVVIFVGIAPYHKQCCQTRLLWNNLYFVSLQFRYALSKQPGLAFLSAFCCLRKSSSPNIDFFSECQWRILISYCTLPHRDDAVASLFIVHEPGAHVSWVPNRTQ